MTLYAVAGRVGVLGAIGLAGLAAAVRSNMSRAASQPRPSPEVCKNLRRERSIDPEFSIDIDEIAHVEDQQTEARQGVPSQIVESGLAFLFTRGAPEGQAPGGFHGSIRILARLLSDPCGKQLRLGG